MISIIHPSRGRPEKSVDTLRKWRKAFMGCEGDVYELIVSVDRDDFTLNTYNKLYGAQLLIGDNKSTVDAINNAANNSRGDILMVVSDDTEPIENWNTEIYKAVEGKTDWILKTKDGIQDWLITMPVMDRAYYNRFGYIYHPDYRHMFCDTELSCVADLTGRRITSNLLFKHNHYSVTGQKKDAISVKADSTWEQGKKLFLERYRRNFDLNADQIKGTIKDKAMINWLAK